MPRLGLTTMGMELTSQPRAKPLRKKSPSGHSTDGVCSPSQNIRSTTSRSTNLPAAVASVTVSQMCWITPGPSMSASTTISPGATLRMQGEPLRDGPRSLAAMAAAPFSPVLFSQLMERERPDFSIGSAFIAPVNPFIIEIQSSLLLDAARHDPFHDLLFKA